jgi:hypothetical protein
VIAHGARRASRGSAREPGVELADRPADLVAEARRQVELQEGPVLGAGAREIATLPEEGGEGDARPGIAGGEGDGAGEGRLGPGIVAEVVAEDAQVVPGAGVARRQGHHDLELGRGVGDLVPGGQLAGQLEARVDLAGPIGRLGDGALVFGARPIVAPGSLVGLGPGDRLAGGVRGARRRGGAAAGGQRQDDQPRDRRAEPAEPGYPWAAMLHKNLIDVLARGGLTRDGDAFVVPQGLAVTVYLDIGEEALIVDRVARIEVGGEVAAVVTHRKERYAIELDGLAAVRFHSEGGGPGYA